MNKYIKTTLIFSGVWFIASILNGLLSGISLGLLEESSMNEAMGNLSLAIIFSYAFSAPLVAIVWFVTVVAQSNGKAGHELLQLVLKTALFCSTAAAVIFTCTIGKEFMNTRYIIGVCIVVSAFTAVLLFRKQIKTNV